MTAQWENQRSLNGKYTAALSPLFAFGFLAMNINFLYVKCPLCKKNNHRILYPTTSKSKPVKHKNFFNCTSPFLAKHGDIVQCQNCGMVYNNPQLDPDQLLHFYNRNMVNGDYSSRNKKNYVLKLE